MSKNQEMKALLKQTDFNLSSNQQKVLILFMGIGLAGFIIGLFDSRSQLVWQALLTNTMFFSGLSMGGIILAVILTITSAHWGRPIKRLSEATFAFVPVSGVLFLLLFFGASHLYEWIDPAKVIHSKAGWLNFPFFVIRNIFMFVVIAFVSWKFFKSSVRPDIGLAKSLTQKSNPFADFFVKNYGLQDSEVAASRHMSKVIAPILGMVYAIFCTFQAFDWMMSLDQEWFSTMFGVQYAMANLIGATAFLMIIAGLARQKFGLKDYISTGRYHDLSKLTFAGCLMWTYMIFSQVLVIWYGNIPEETPYIILRMQSLEWGWMFWFIAILLFIVPFFGLMSRTACNSVIFSRIIAVEILIGLWLEKYFLIVPSVQENYSVSPGLPGFSLNLYDITITVGVLSGFLFCYFWVLQKIPILPISDYLLFKDDQH